MTATNKRRPMLVFDICVSFLILLFAYAGLSKLMQFETFKFQLGKSPLIPFNIRGAIAVFLPAGEILISLMLLTEKGRLPGLYISFFLLSFFTFYLFYIIHFSYYIPCSCGGILGSLSWTTHIYFNIFFIFISTAAIYLHEE